VEGGSSLEHGQLPPPNLIFACVKFFSCGINNSR